MDEYYLLDMQSLVDLLAIETEKYTKACVANVPAEIVRHGAVLDALVMEINTRKAQSGRLAQKAKRFKTKTRGKFNTRS